MTDDFEKNMELWRKSLIDWSTSEFGFYIYRRPDPSRKKKWIYEEAPIVWQPHQIKVARFLFTLQDDNTFPYPEVWWLDVGQSGKSLMHAAIAQWCGMFHEKNAEVQLAANSEGQAGIRVYAAVKRSIEMNPRSALIADTQSKMITFHATGNIVRPIPLKAGTQAGGTPVFRGFDEIWDYEGSEATLFFDEIKESPASETSLMLATSYPPYDDSDGPMNKVLNKYFRGDDTPKEGVLEKPFDDIPLYLDDEAKIAIYWNHDALLYPWITDDFLSRKKLAPGATESGYMRIWLAHRSNREETFMPMEKWDACEDDSLLPLSSDYDRNIMMVISVDMMGGKIYSDCAAATARGYDPATMRYPLYAHKIWDPAKIMDPEFDFNEAVEEWIIDMASRHNVLAVYYDPYQFVSSANRLKNTHGIKMVEVTQNTMRITADTHYRDLIFAKRLRNYPQSQDLRQHVANAIAKIQSNGAIRIDKLKSNRRVDGAVSDSMCCLGVDEHKADFEREARGVRPVTINVSRNRWKGVYWNATKNAHG